MESANNNEKSQPFPEYQSTPTYGPGAATVNTVPGIQPQSYTNYTVQRSHCENVQRSNIQSNSVVGGVLLLFVSGLHIAWGIWRIEFREPWSYRSTISIQIFVLMCWYVFSTIGGIIGAVLVSNIRKKLIYYIGSIIIAISSIVFIIWYDSSAAIIIGRCFAGLAHGIVYNAVITHAGENAIKEIRGMVLSSISFMTTAAMLTATIIISTAARYTTGPSSDRIIGIIGLIISVLSFLGTTFLTYESVPFLLRRNMEEEAVTNILKLRTESVMTAEINNDFNEMKLMVSQDKQENQNIFSHGNGTGISKMIGLRIMSNLSNNLLLNTILVVASIFILDLSNYYMAPIMLVGARFAGALISVFTSDLIRRKSFVIVSGICSGSLIMVLGIILYVGVNAAWLYATLAILIQFFAGIGIDPIQHVYLSEAFSTSKKAWSICYVTAAENISQILLIGVAYTEVSTGLAIFIIMLITSILLNGLAIILLWALPETAKTSLIQARDLFRKGFYQQYVTTGHV